MWFPLLALSLGATAGLVQAEPTAQDKERAQLLLKLVDKNQKSPHEIVDILRWNESPALAGEVSQLIIGD